MRGSHRHDSLQQIAVRFVELLLHGVACVMATNVLLVFDRRRIAFLISVYADSLQFGGQARHALHHFQIIIENEAAALQHQNLEERLDRRVADVRSLHRTIPAELRCPCTWAGSSR